MKKYKVTLYYHTSVNVVVLAENEDDAIEKAYDEVTDEELLDGLTKDDDPDVEEVKD